MTAILMAAPAARAAEIQTFLQSCGWGTLAGMAVGTLSLAFEDKPSEHTINIARGASLGLYGGIFYGLAEMQRDKRDRESVLGLVPTWDRDRHIDGLRVEGLVARF